MEAVKTRDMDEDIYDGVLGMGFSEGSKFKKLTVHYLFVARSQFKFFWVLELAFYRSQVFEEMVAQKKMDQPVFAFWHRPLRRFVVAYFVAYFGYKCKNTSQFSV